MNRLKLSVSMMLTSVAGAYAHGGHIAAEGGHDHWVAVAAAVVVVLLALGAFVRQRARR